MKRYPNTTILLSYMLVLLCACFSLILVSFKHKSQRLFKVPLIINKGKDAPICLSPNFMMKAVHTVERVEKFDNTLDLASSCKWPQETYITSPSKNDYFTNEGLKVIVDTQNEIGVTIRQHMPAVMGFPVYIINQASHQTANIATQNGKLHMIIEAMSTKNTWEAIEYLPQSSFTTTNYTIDLPPQHYAFIRGINHCGEHITKCRIKLMSGKDVFYSNEFEMGLNYTQFEKI